jgi:hypothetical protein
MSIEGIWTGEILGPYEWENSGVYILERGRIIGGNNRHYSTGTYELDGDRYTSTVSVHYYGPPRTVFSDARRDFEINVTGKLVDGTLIEAEVVRSDRPKTSVIYRMTKRMDLAATGKPG